MLSRRVQMHPDTHTSGKTLALFLKRKKQRRTDRKQCGGVSPSPVIFPFPVEIENTKRRAEFLKMPSLITLKWMAGLVALYCKSLLIYLRRAPKQSRSN